MAEEDCSTVLYIEPYYGGSHQQLMDLLMEELPGDLYTLPATKWHWRMRTSALHFSLTLPHKESYRTLFASSVLNLCELISLRPDLSKLHKVIYFHENQLIYPVRKRQDRDFQYGYNEVLSCLVADKVFFNSSFNMESFLSSIDSHLKLLPDHRPQGLAETIRYKCSVLYYPLKMEVPLNSPTRDIVREACCKLPIVAGSPKGQPHTNTTVKISENIGVEGLRISMETVATAHAPLHIVWPHRWEHDKGPDEFSSVITKLLDANIDFTLSILGAHTNDTPECFSSLFPRLGARLVHRGPVPRTEYWEVLVSADVVVSTARHEFFGVAMLEAVSCGCYPLCPNRLVYPELYPEECLYNTEQQLFKRLRRFCTHPHLPRQAAVHKMMCLERFHWRTLKEEYSHRLNISHCKDKQSQTLIENES
ncbi:tRNA-queuosine alpha-mannosyltransferase-like [Halichondria panicea]|uniref:tRNA-queuosine alpha-mannosyltransferase-like n=1 Tax=Halichondria panicea TaxID=6063 RepID=UPI00312B62D2